MSAISKWGPGNISLKQVITLRIGSKVILRPGIDGILRVEDGVVSIWRRVISDDVKLFNSLNC